MLYHIQPPGLGKFMVNSNGWFSHRLPQRSQLRGYRSAASFSTGEPRMKSNPSHHQWASIHILDHRQTREHGGFFRQPVYSNADTDHPYFCCCCMQVKIDFIAGEDFPRPRTAASDIILIGHCGAPEAQVPPRARKSSPPPCSIHALRGACFSSL